MTENKTKTGRVAPDNAAAHEAEAEERLATAQSDETLQQQEVGASGEAEKERVRKSGALTGAAKAIEEGVGYVGEKAPKVASFVLHKVRKGVSVAYGTGSTFVKDVYSTASDYAEKYKHKVEIRRLKAQREGLTSRLGSVIYSRVVINEEPPERLFLDQQISNLLQQIQNLDADIVRIGKEQETH